MMKLTRKDSENYAGIAGSCGSPCGRRILRAYEEVIETLTNISGLDAEQEQIQSEIQIVVEMIRKLIAENTQTAMDQADCECKYNGYCARHAMDKIIVTDIFRIRACQKIAF